MGRVLDLQNRARLRVDPFAINQHLLAQEGYCSEGIGHSPVSFKPMVSDSTREFAEAICED
jgi:hypothetical protein